MCLTPEEPTTGDGRRLLLVELTWKKTLLAAPCVSPGLRYTLLPLDREDDFLPHSPGVFVLDEERAASRPGSYVIQND